MVSDGADLTPAPDLCEHPGVGYGIPHMPTGTLEALGNPKLANPDLNPNQSKADKKPG